MELKYYKTIWGAIIKTDGVKVVEVDKYGIRFSSLTFDQYKDSITLEDSDKVDYDNLVISTSSKLNQFNSL